MIITVNGKKQALTHTYTILDFLRSKEIEPKTVVVERNGDILNKSDWGTIELGDGDVLEILKLMGGGTC